VVRLAAGGSAAPRVAAADRGGGGAPPGPGRAPHVDLGLAVQILGAVRIAPDEGLRPPVPLPKRGQLLRHQIEALFAGYSLDAHGFRGPGLYCAPEHPRHGPANLIARFESKLDAQNAMTAAQDAKWSCRRGLGVFSNPGLRASGPAGPGRRTGGRWAR